MRLLAEVVLMGRKAPYFVLHCFQLCTATRETGTAGDIEAGVTQAAGRHRQLKLSVLNMSCAASQPDPAQCSYHRHLAGTSGQPQW